jgi:hypothetical protein
MGSLAFPWNALVPGTPATRSSIYADFIGTARRK